MTINHQQMNVLVVEDDYVASMIAIAILQRKNCAVTLATNGAETIEKIKPEHHFCLLEIGMNGFLSKPFSPDLCNEIIGLIVKMY